jgi:hypothetical protein
MQTILSLPQVVVNDNRLQLPVQRMAAELKSKAPIV